MAIFSSKYTGSFESSASFGRIDIEDNVKATSFTGIFEGALSSSVQIADDISGSLGTNATLIRSLTANGISGSLGDNATLIRSLTASGISGSVSAVSASLANRISTNEAASASFSSRVATEEANVDTLQSRTLTAGVGLSGGGDLTDDRTFDIDFTDSTFKSGISGSLGTNADLIRSLTASGISGSFTTDSASFSSRISTDSASFSSRISTDSASFSTRISSDSSSFSSRISSDSSSFSTRVSSNEALLDQSVKSDARPTFAGLTIEGKITTQELVVSSSIVSMSVQQASGSTQFGDDIQDTHLFTGSVSISGSVEGSSFDGIFVGALSSSAQIADDISGSFTQDSASFSTRLTTEESNVDALQARNINSGVGLSGGGDLTSDRTLAIDFTDSTFQSGISGSFTQDSSSFSERISNLSSASASFSTRVTLNESTGSKLDLASGSFSTRTTNLETTMVAEQANIDALQADSASFSTRVTTEEANVDALQVDSASFSTRTTNLEGRNINSGTGLSGGGNLSSDRTLAIDFTDSDFQTGISGSFSATSASIATDIREFKDGTIPLVSGSGVSTASFGTYMGDGSQLTGIDTSPFPFTGSAGIQGEIVITGNVSGSAVSTGSFGGVYSAGVSRFAGNVGIGTTNPQAQFHLAKAAPQILLEDTDVSGLKHTITGGGNAGLEIGVDNNNTGAGYFRISLGGAQRVNITEAGLAEINLGVSGSAASTGSFGDGRFAGKVGIGNTSPSRTLDVTGDIGASTNIILGGAAYTTDIITRTGNNLYFKTSGGSIIQHLKSTLETEFKGTINVTSGNISGSATSTGSFGKLGIGIGAPEKHLTVKGPSGTLANFTNGSTDFVIYQDNSNSQIANSTSLVEQKLNMSIAEKQFKFYNDGSEAMVITGSGEQSLVVINPGSAHPGVGDNQHGLYVHKDVGDARITIDSATNSDAMLRFFNGGTLSHFIYSDGSDTNDPLRFYDAALGGVAMSLNNGNLGIGVTDPTYKLDVAGNIGVNGAIIHNDDTDTYIQFSTNTIGFYTGNSGGVANFQINLNSVSGSSTTTGSFGRVETDFIQARNIRTRRFRGFSPLAFEDSINITGSIDFKDGHLSGSSTSTGSFGRVEIGGGGSKAGWDTKLWTKGTTTAATTIHIESTNASAVSALRFETNGNDWYWAAGGSSQGYFPNKFYLYNESTGINPITFTNDNKIGLGSRRSPSYNLDNPGTARTTGKAVFENHLVTSPNWGRLGVAMGNLTTGNDPSASLHVRFSLDDTATSDALREVEDTDVNYDTFVNGLILENTNDAANTGGKVHIRSGGSRAASVFLYGENAGSAGNSRMSLWTENSATAYERISLESNGDVVFGTTVTNISGSATSTGSFGRVFSDDDIELGGNAIIFNTATGFVTNAGGAMTIQGTGNVVLDAGAGDDEVTLTTSVLTSIVPINVGSGNASSPVYSFTGDTDTGIFRIGANNLGISTGGTQRIAVSSTNTEFSTDIVSTKANGVISGSSSSTGSFGSIETAGNITIPATKYLYLDGGGNTYLQESSADNVKLYVGGTDMVSVNSSGLTVSGDIIAERFVVSSSVSVITQSFSSGSTIFGDTLDDTHQFTGSLRISGDMGDNISGSAISTGSFGQVYVGGKTPSNQNLHIQGSDDVTAGLRISKRSDGNGWVLRQDNKFFFQLNYWLGNNSSAYSTPLMAHYNGQVTASVELYSPILRTTNITISPSGATDTIRRSSGDLYLQYGAGVGQKVFAGHTGATAIWDGGVSGSSTSTGSFGKLLGDGSDISNLPAAAITTYNSAADNRIITSVNSTTVQGEADLTFDGTILSGSASTTGSFGQVSADDYRSLNNTIFVDGSAKTFGIGKAAYGSTSTDGAWFSDLASANGFVQISVNGTNEVLSLNQNSTGPILLGKNSGTEKFRVKADGNVTASLGGKFGGVLQGTKIQTSNGGGPQLVNSTPNATTPSIYPTMGDTNTGIGYGGANGSTADNLNLITGGTTGLYIDSSQNVVVPNGNISGSEVSASAYYGDGSNLTGISTTPFPFTGSAGISGSFQVTNQGRELFNVLDNFNSANSGSDQILFNVNNSAGVPIFQAEASRSRVLMGGVSGLETFFKPNGHYVLQSSSPVSASFEDIVLNGSNIHDVFINEGDLVGFPFTASHAGGPDKAGIQGALEVTGSISIDTDSANSGSSLFRVRGNHGNLIEAIDDKNIGLFRVPNLIGFDALHIDKNSNITFDNGVNPQIISGSSFSTASFGKIQTGNITENSTGIQIGTAGNHTTETLRVNNKIIIHQDSSGAGDSELTFDRRHDGAYARIKAVAGASGAMGTELHFVTKKAGTGEITALQLDDNGHIYSDIANAKISGSSTSTGSFGMLGIGVASPNAAAQINNDVTLRSALNIYQNASGTAGVNIVNTANTNQGLYVYTAHSSPSSHLLYVRSDQTTAFPNSGTIGMAGFHNDNPNGIAIDTIGDIVLASGNVSGSSTSTGSFGRIFADGSARVDKLGIGTENDTPRKLQITSTNTTNAAANIYTNAVHTGTTDNSVFSVRSDNASSTGNVMNIHNDGSGASLTLNGGGKVMISGSATSTGSFGMVMAGGTALTPSPNATDGSQNIISGSGVSTGSFGTVESDSITVAPNNINASVSINSNSISKQSILFLETDASSTSWYIAGAGRGASPFENKFYIYNRATNGQALTIDNTNKIGLGSRRSPTYSFDNPGTARTTGTHYFEGYVLQTSSTGRLGVAMGSLNTLPSASLHVKWNLDDTATSDTLREVINTDINYYATVQGILLENMNDTANTGAKVHLRSGGTRAANAFVYGENAGSAGNSRMSLWTENSATAYERISLESNGDVLFGTTVTNISGSATSTGSFGLVLQNGSELSTFQGAAGTEALFSGSAVSTGSFAHLSIPGQAVVGLSTIKTITSGSSLQINDQGLTSVGVDYRHVTNDVGKGFTQRFLAGDQGGNVVEYGRIKTEIINRGSGGHTGKFIFSPTIEATATEVMNIGTGGVEVTRGNVSGSATSTGSFGKLLGDGSQITGLSSGTTVVANPGGSGTTLSTLSVAGSTFSIPSAFPFTGSAGISGSLSIDRQAATTGSTILDVKGSQGTLFSVVDNMSGSIFSANTVAGIPVIEAFSDGTVHIGPNVSGGTMGKLFVNDSQIAVGGGTGFPFTGSAGLSGSLEVKHLQAATGSTLLSVHGSEGALFSVVNSMTGSIFSANTTAGIPVIEAFSDGKVEFGPLTKVISGSGVSTGSFGKLFVGGTEVAGSPVTALNNATANRLVTIGATTTELDGEQHLTWNGTKLVVGSQAVDFTTDSDSFIINNDGNDVYLKLKGYGGNGTFTMGDGAAHFVSTNVGIGTNNPSNKLTVEDTIGIKRSGVAAITTLQMAGSGLIVNGHSGYHPLIIQSNGTELARFKNDGNLGVGTSLPEEKLHVDGNIKANGNIIAQNYIVSSSVTHMTQSFSTGGTIFGNDTADFHRFTGSLEIKNTDAGIHVKSSNGDGHIIAESTHAASSGVVDIRSVVDRDSSLIFREGTTAKAQVFNDSSDDQLVLTDGSNANTIFIRGTKVGIGGQPVSGATLYVNGNVKGDAFIENSSIRLKTNIETLENPLDKISKLRGVSYNLKKDNTPSIGMIAEEVNEVFPELVEKDDSGEVQAMSYTRMTAVLLEAVKELKEEVKELKKSNIYYKNKDK